VRTQGLSQQPPIFKQISNGLGDQRPGALRNSGKCMQHNAS
jgi:hypothetical protein